MHMRLTGGLNGCFRSTWDSNAVDRRAIDIRVEREKEIRFKWKLNIKEEKAFHESNIISLID